MRLPRLAASIASSLLAFSLLSSSAALAVPFRQLDADAGADRISEVAPTARIDRAKLTAALAKRRAQNLALFRAYRTAGVYPHNFVTDGKLNVWQDEEGRLCAAATIIARSGNADLVTRVAEDDNFIRLADVTDGELMDWILTSGLTQEEIVAIQEPFEGGGMYRLPVDEPVTPDPRVVEDARLRKRYAQVDRQIVKDQKQSLARAFDRLMAHPHLAQQLLAAS